MTSDFQLLFQTQLTNRMRYDMISHLRYRDAAELPRYELQRALRLPASANPRTRELARDMRKRAADDRAYINDVLGMFRNQNFSYTTTPPLLGANPVDEFLLTTRAGYCEHYASAFAVLMRAARRSRAHRHRLSGRRTQYGGQLHDRAPGRCARVGGSVARR